VGVGERIIEVLGGVTQSALADTARRAYENGYNDRGEDEPVSGTTAKYGYRSMRGGMRDKRDREADLATAWALWQSHPVAQRDIEIKRDYIIGRGTAPQAKDDKLQEILDEFWRINEMDLRAAEFTQQLFIFGYQALPAFVRQADGQTRLGYIDPGEIENVIADPENAMDLYAVVVKEQQAVAESWQDAHGKRVYRIVHEAKTGDESNDKGDAGDLVGKLVRADQAQLEPWEQQMLKSFGLSAYTGDCFYVKINSLSNQAFGMSDYLAEADWLDQIDQTLFALGEREQMRDYFSFDVEIEGADDTRVRERANEIRNNPPRKGSVNIHNNREHWQMHAPNLGQAGTVETVKEQLAFILGGLGLPVHWYGRGDETNRATAQAQGDPTWRSLEHAQLVVKRWFERMLAFVRDQAIIAGKYTPDEDADTDVTLAMPEMTVRDMNTLAAAMSQVAGALVVALDQRLMSQEQAIEVWVHVVNEMGIELTPIEVEEEIEPDERGDHALPDWGQVHTELEPG